MLTESINNIGARLSNGDVIRTGEIFVLQYVRSKVDEIGKELADNVSPRFKELVKVTKKKMRYDIHLSVLKLNDIDPPGVEHRAKTMKHEMFSTLDVDLEKVDPIDLSVLHVLVAPTNRTDDYTIVAMGICHMRGQFVGASEQVHRDRTGLVRQAEIIQNHSCFSSEAIMQSGIGAFHNLERVQLGVRESVTRQHRPITNIRSDVEYDGGVKSGEAIEQPILAVVVPIVGIPGTQPV